MTHAGRPVVHLEAPPEVQVLGDGVLIRGRAAVDTYRIFAGGLRQVSVRDGITPHHRLQQVLAGLKSAAATARAAGVADIADIADIADVRNGPPPPSLRTGELINLADVAQMLGLSERQARRRAGELGGWKRHPKAAWQFDRGLVATYINEAGGTIR